MTRKLLMTVAIIAIGLTPSIGIGTAQAHGFGGGFGGGGFQGGGFGGRGFNGGGFDGRGFARRGFFNRGFFRRVWWLLSRLLWIRVCPVLLLYGLLARPPATDRAWLTAWRAGSSDTKPRDPPCG